MTCLFVGHNPIPRASRVMDVRAFVSGLMDGKQLLENGCLLELSSSEQQRQQDCSKGNQN